MKDVARSADGIPVHFEVEAGGAPPLVFVHGWSCDRTYWRHQIDDFAGRHEVVAIDLAGHGESGSGRPSPQRQTLAGHVGPHVIEMSRTASCSNQFQLTANSASLAVRCDDVRAVRLECVRV